MSSHFGKILQITTFGESHGVGVGVVVDGLPSRLPVEPARIQAALDRRRPGQSKITTQRKEADEVEILSGVSPDGLSLGTPIAMLIRNTDQRSRDYNEMAEAYRPSHADFAYDQKYGIRAVAGGGRASARETIGRVAAGALAETLLERLGVTIVGSVAQIADISASLDSVQSATREQVDQSIVRSPDPIAQEKMLSAIEEARKSGDSLGGVVYCRAEGVPAGWGEPIFDKLEADLAKAMLSLPACKGFESGDGFALTTRRGSEVNDLFVSTSEGVRTATNHSGGIQGGISNGMPVVIRAAFKPTATIAKEQATVDTSGEAATIRGKGRHDPCVLPRAVPIVEAMMALVLADHALRQAARTNFALE